jgi:hypothetical protein
MYERMKIKQTGTYNKYVEKVKMSLGIEDKK